MPWLSLSRLAGSSHKGGPLESEIECLKAAVAAQEHQVQSCKLQADEIPNRVYTEFGKLVGVRKYSIV